MTDKEKLEKIKVLADAMYNRMQNLTTDTSGIRKAMYDYHQFIINEYYKEEPVSKDLEEAAYNFVMNNFGNPKEPLYKFDQRCFKAGAQWQKEQTIDKACEWLLKNESYAKPTEVLVRDFKQALEKQL